MRLIAPSCLFLAMTILAQEPPPAVPVPSISDQNSPEAAADPEKKPVAPKVTETMVVTATRTERAVSELPMSTSVISDEKIESAPAAAVDDLLRSTPGVHLALLGSGSHAGSSGRISMRGLGGTRALVLLDGIPLHDTWYGTVQWQKVPLGTIRQVEVIRGGSAGLFGNYALGGTINLLTRPVDGSQISADTAWGNMGSQRHSLTADHLLNPALGLRFSHHRSESDGFHLFVIPGPFDIPSWNNTAVTSGRIEYTPSEATRATFKSSWSDINAANGDPISHHEREIFDVSAGLQRAVGKSGLLSTTLFHQSEEYRDYDGSPLPGGLALYPAAFEVIPSSTTGGSVEWSKQRNGTLSFISVGADFQLMEVDQTEWEVNPAGAETSRRSLEGQQQFGGLFGQASWRPGDRVEVVTSLRLDYYRNEEGAERVGTVETIYPTATSTQLDPRVSIRYTLSPRTVMRASAYRAFKAPTLRDLYRSARSRGVVTIANPYLEPETLVGAELGFEWVLPRTHILANVYRSEVEGLAARAPVSPGIVQAQNLGRIRSQGLELMAEVDLSRGWSIEAGYTYADSIIVDDPDTSLEGKEVPEVPPHVGTLSLRYRGFRGTTFDLRGRTVARSYGDPTNGLAQPAHRVLDVSVSHPLRPWLDAYVLAENVLDERYYYLTSVTTKRAAQPRSVMGGLRFRLPARDGD